MVAKKRSTFDEILLQGIRKGQVPARSKKAREWFRRKAKQFKVSGEDLLKEDKSRQRAKTKIQVGRMFMYVYDPKHKKTLPYYDKFPLIFPIAFRKKGFLGINLHYLPPVLRAQLMEALYSLINNKKFDETTKLKISYKILKRASKFKAFKPCIKEYLYSHVKSRLIEVYSSEWDIGLFLPTADWAKASQQKVWRDSRKMI